MLKIILENPNRYRLDGVVHFELEIDYPFISNQIEQRKELNNIKDITKAGNKITKQPITMRIDMYIVYRNGKRYDRLKDLKNTVKRKEYKNEKRIFKESL